MKLIPGLPDDRGGSRSYFPPLFFLSQERGFCFTLPEAVFGSFLSLPFFLSLATGTKTKLSVDEASLTTTISDSAFSLFFPLPMENKSYRVKALIAGRF